MDLLPQLAAGFATVLLVASVAFAFCMILAAEFGG